VKILYEESKWKSIASALEKVNEAHKYDNKYEHADDLFKDSKSEIADKDIDRAISFSPQTYQPEAKPIREKYKKLYDYAKGIGKIIDEKVDEPFYKSIDEYMQQMADMNVSAYTTANTINVQTGPFFNRHDKKEIKLTDLYEADTEYSDHLKAEYKAWKLQNPDVKASQEDYETAALNSGAFEYEGIRAGQEKKEFWFNLIATGVVVGLTIVCPPAGLVAGAAYTAIDVGGAITGEDLISGRKLSDNERLIRGAFAIVPGAGAVAGKALLKNMPALANVMKSAYKTVENAGGSALKSTLEHARNLGKAHGDQLKFTLKHPVLAAVTSKTGQQTVRQSAKFIDNALRPIEVRAVQTNAGNVVTGVERGLPSGKLPAKADEYLAIKQAEKDGVLAGKGAGRDISKIEIGRADLDILRKKLNVPETHTIAVGKTDISELKGKLFEGSSIKVRREAGLPDLDVIMPNRDIRAPYDGSNPRHIQFMKHAEEGVINEFDIEIKKLGIDPNKVEGTLAIHQSNPRGVCSICTQGMTNPKKEAGIFMQLTKKYPNLTIEVTTEVKEGIRVSGKESFILKNGKLIN